MQTATDYWEIAYAAIKVGLITKEEANTIARIGHRKQRYWARHIRDLEAVIEQRLDERIVDSE